MNCERLAGIVTELARDRRSTGIDPTLPESAAAHLDNCAECLVRFQDERGLTRQLQELATQMKLLTGPAHLEAQLLKTYRESVSSNTTTRQRIARVNLWKSAALAAAVILFVAIVGLSWYSTRRSRPGEHRPDRVAQNTPREPQVVVNRLIAQKVERPLPTINRIKNVRRKHAPKNTGHEPLNPPVSNDVEREVATHFMPIGFAGPINPQDGGELVRVELSRSAMLSLGLPVNMDRFGQSVKADVLLGSDGFARAIRFVQ